MTHPFLALRLPARTSTAGLLVAACALPLVLSACTAGSTAKPSATGSGSAASVLNLGLILEPTSLDFTKQDAAAIPQVLLGNVYETLVKVDQDGKIVPSLAKSWTISPDRTTYTFDLVDNATFSNGEKFTAEDAAFSIERAKTEWTISKAKVMQVVASAKAASPSQLVVTLSKPSNMWLQRMTTQVGAMFSRTGVAELATTPIGTGPYSFGTWKKGESISLTRNESYWGAKPAFQTVNFRYVKDATALNNALATGAIDVITTVQAPEALGRFTADPAYQVIEGTTNAEVVLSFNNARAPFDKPAVRQAARAAIDHDALIKTCWAGKGTKIGSMVPPTDPWYEDLTGVIPFDQAKSKALLSSAGVPNPSVRLRIPGLPYAVSCGQVVKNQLEAVGFKVSLEQVEWATWLSDIFKGGNYEMSIVAHVESRDLPNVFGNPDYYIHYKNPALTALLAEADAGDETTQVAKMKEAARLISADAASDWLFLLPNLMVAKKDITGLPKNAITDYFDLSTLGRG